MTDSLLAARERKGAPVSRPRAGRDGAVGIPRRCSIGLFPTSTRAEGAALRDAPLPNLISGKASMSYSSMEKS